MEKQTIGEELAYIETLSRRARMLVLIHLGISVLALTLLFVLRRVGIPAAVLLAGLAFYFLAVRRANRRYLEEAAAASIRFGLCDGLEDLSVRASGGMDRDGFTRWAMLPVREKGGSFLSRNAFSGRVGETRCSGGEITVHYRAGAERARPEYRFLVGSLLTAEAPAANAGAEDWLLLREDLLEEHARDRFLAENGYAAAEAMLVDWDIYRRGAPGDAGALRFPEELARRVLAFTDAAESVGALRFAPDGAAVYLHRRFYTGAGAPAAKLTEDALRENPLPERDAVWQLMRAWLEPGEEPGKNTENS